MLLEEAKLRLEVRKAHWKLLMQKTAQPLSSRKLSDNIETISKRIEMVETLRR